MADYFISFRIADKTIGGKSYDDRRAALINAVHSDVGFWDGTTSFIAVTSRLDTHGFAASATEPLSETDDMLIVFDPGDLSMAYFGKVDHPDILASFFRTSKKI